MPPIDVLDLALKKIALVPSCTTTPANLQERSVMWCRASQACRRVSSPSLMASRRSLGEGVAAVRTSQGLPPYMWVASSWLSRRSAICRATWPRGHLPEVEIATPSPRHSAEARLSSSSPGSTSGHDDAPLIIELKYARCNDMVPTTSLIPRTDTTRQSRNDTA